MGSFPRWMFSDSEKEKLIQTLTANLPLLRARMDISQEEIAKIIGVDSLGFLNVEHLPKLADHSTCGFCNGCFTGNYPVDPPRDTAKLKFERSLTERQKTEEGNL